MVEARGFRLVQEQRQSAAVRAKTALVSRHRDDVRQ
jgi:hypothetical protein